MTAAVSLRQALEDARQGGEVLEALSFDRADAESPDFSDLTFRQLSFQACHFTGCDLTGAELFRTPFKGMDLSSCTLDRVSLSETCAELRGAKLHVGQAAVVARILGIEIVP